MKKKLSNWTSKDFHAFWCEQFNKYHGKDYQVHGYIGNELSLLKTLLEEYGPFALGSAIILATKSKDIDSLSLFELRFDRFNYAWINPRVNWYILTENATKYAKLATELMWLNAKWLKSASDLKHMKEINELLESWVGVKND